MKSSCLKSIGYDGRLFFVRFKNNRLYSYKNVSPELFNLFCSTAKLVKAGEPLSVGKLFIAVKSNPDRYPYKEVKV